MEGGRKNGAGQNIATMHACMHLCMHAVPKTPKHFSAALYINARYSTIRFDDFSTDTHS